jgi:hypothetical protein
MSSNKINFFAVGAGKSVQRCGADHFNMLPIGKTVAQRGQTGFDLIATS